MDVEESNVLDKFANYGPRGFQTDIVCSIEAQMPNFRLTIPVWK